MLFQVVRNFAKTIERPSKSIDRTNTRGVTWRSSVAENFCQFFFWSKPVSFNSCLLSVFVWLYAFVLVLDFFFLIYFVCAIFLLIFKKNKTIKNKIK
jgi:hypothetical protein